MRQAGNRCRPLCAGVFATAALAIGTLQAPAWAMRFGEAPGSAQLGEPLSLRIPLHFDAQDVASVEVRLIELETPGDWIRDSGGLLRRMRLSFERDGTGRTLLRVQGLAPLKEPYIAFTLEAISGQQRTQQRYTVLAQAPASRAAPQRAVAAAISPAPRRPAAPTALQATAAASTVSARAAAAPLPQSAALRPAAAPATPAPPLRRPPPRPAADLPVKAAEEPARLPGPVVPPAVPGGSPRLGKLITAVLLLGAATAVFVFGGMLLRGAGAPRVPRAPRQDPRA